MNTNPDYYFHGTGLDEHMKIFEGVEHVWQALGGRLKQYIDSVIRPGIRGRILDGAWLMGDDIEIGEGTVVEPGALIRGPVIIGRDTEVRHGAYIRGNVIIGNKCVVGHATEVKSSILMDGAKAGHFAYIGDSILGRNVNLGAGTKLANLKVTEGSVVLKIGGTSFDTGLRKFGAVIGDFSELGCNSVTNPGTLIGPHSRVYPCTSIKGFLPEKTIVKLRQQCSIITLQETPDDDKV